MKKVLFIILCALSATAINAQLLWKIEGGNLKSPSYIVGTHHLAPISMLDSINGIREAIRTTTRVVGELKMSELRSPKVLNDMQSMMVMKGDTTLRSLMTDEEYLQVHKAVSRYLDFDISMMPNLKPAFLLNNITVMMYQRNVGGFNPQEQLDEMLQSLCVSRNHQVYALETPEYQFNLLYNSGTLRRQVDLLLCALNNEEREVAGMKELTDMYIRQDLDGMMKLSDQTYNDGCDPLPGEMERMMDVRNAAWVEKLPELMAGEPTLIVVGALHLPGDKGLLALLKAKGYKLTPVK